MTGDQGVGVELGRTSRLRRTFRRGLVPLPILAVAAVAWFRLVQTAWPYMVDDAWITFRYAQNLAAGLGPTFNPGEPPVEGYSTFTWMLLMALPHLLHLDPIPFAKVVGVLCAVGVVIVCARFVHRLVRADTAIRDAAAAAVVLLISLVSATTVHAVAGMETMLFSLCFIAFFASIPALATGNRGGAVRCGLLGLLVGLTRPEGNLAVVVALTAAVFFAPRARRRGLVLVFACTYLLPLAVYETWRWTYYGLPFPLAYYIKVGAASGLAGSAEAHDFLRDFGAWVGVLVVLGILSAGRRLAAMLLAAVAWLVFYLFPEPIMSYDKRYLYPLVPIFMVLAAIGLATLYQGLLWLAPFGRPRWRQLAAAAVSLGVLAAVCVVMHREAKAVAEQRKFWGPSLETAHVAIGRALAPFAAMTPPPTLAVADAGAIPYYSEWRTLDIFGLNDPAIARRGHDPGYILRRKPDLLILNSNDETAFEARMPWVEDLYDASVAAGMFRFHVWQFGTAYYIWMLAWPDTPLVQHLARARDHAIDPAVTVQCKHCGAGWRVQSRYQPWNPVVEEILPCPPSGRPLCPRCHRRLVLPSPAAGPESG